MVEIFTTGGGEYIVNVLNAVAAWTGAGGYKSLIQVALVMGFALAVIVVAFHQDWRAWLNWFLGATLIYMCLMVPRMRSTSPIRSDLTYCPSYGTSSLHI